MSWRVLRHRAAFPLGRLYSQKFALIYSSARHIARLDQRAGGTETPNTMKKMLALLSLALLANAAHADWTRADFTSDKVTVYFDRDSLKTAGVGVVQMWHLYDFASAQDYSGKPYLSFKGQDEYDCERGLRRDMMALYHKDGMGNSQMVQAVYKPGPWTRPEPGSEQAALLQIACGK